MKILIFEGIDNLGKSTLMHNFAKKFADKYNIVMIHSRKPSPESGEDPFKFQSAEFREKAMLISHLQEYEYSCEPYYSRIIDTKKIHPMPLPSNMHPLEEILVMLDRSWIDEYVYGQMYRKENRNDIISMIDGCFEDLMLNHGVFCVPDIAIIKLCATAEFSISHDDDKSFTSHMNYTERIETVKDEIRLFDEIISYCTTCSDYAFGIKYVNENVMDGPETYRKSEDIMESILRKLKVNCNMIL